MSRIPSLLDNQKISKLQLNYNLPYTGERPQVLDSRIAAALFLPSFEKHMQTREAFRILLLDASMRSRGLMTISKGGVSSTTVCTKLVFGAAVLTLSSAMILCHNHPSGDFDPSVADVELTRKIAHCCALFDIVLRDHLILTSTGYFSFQDKGMMP